MALSDAPSCHYCHIRAKTRHCAPCGVTGPRYCSSACQRYDWSRHKQQCTLSTVCESFRKINFPTAVRKIIQSFLLESSAVVNEVPSEDKQRADALGMTIHCIPGILGANSKHEKRALIAHHRSSGIQFDDRLEKALIDARFRNMKEEVIAYHIDVAARMEEMERETKGLREDVVWHLAWIDDIQRKRCTESLAATLAQDRLEAEIKQLKIKIKREPLDPARATNSRPRSASITLPGGRRRQGI